MTKKTDKNNQDRKIRYAVSINNALSEVLFDKESDHFIGEEWTEHLNEFFTAIEMSACNIFNKLTGESKSLLEYNQKVNTLIAQHIVERLQVDNKIKTDGENEKG